MKLKTLLIASLLVIGGALFQSTAQAQENPRIKTPNKLPPNLKLYRPDLRLTAVKIQGSKMLVTVINRCKGKATNSRLGMTLYKGALKNSGAEIYIEADVPALAGNAEATVTFDVSQEPLVKSKSFEGKYYRLEADPLNKIKEMIENNNWSEKNSAPFPDAANSCEP